MAKESNISQPHYDTPDADQLEISLFGPGYGECVVVHYGNGQWFTVDSCLEEDIQTPSAVAYLHRLGLDPANCVTHNVITHPDGDHIGGISSLFSACSSATLVCPGILTEKHMLSYFTYYSRTDPTPLTQTTRELYDVLNLSLNRPPGQPRYVAQDTPFIDNGGARVTALAPSDKKIQKFLGRISQQIPTARSDRLAPGKLLPNEVSVALLIQMGQFTAILGADLEENPGQGWTTILNDSISFRNAPAPRAFKVAHHGSNNANCPRLWSAMNHPIAFLTPFNRGTKKLPAPSDVDRILEQTSEAFCTSSFKTRTVKRLSRADKILSGHGIRHRDLYPKNGHIRLRVDTNGETKVSLFQSAVHLSKVH